MMEVAAISGHKSLNMLKRYTHLRAYQLVKKIDSKKKQLIKSHHTLYHIQQQDELSNRDTIYNSWILKSLKFSEKIRIRLSQMLL